MSGPRGAILLDGQKVGWATQVEVREGIEYRPVRVLDEIEVVSHEPVAYNVQVTMATLTIVGKSLQQMGYFPKGGSQLGSRLLEILGTDELTMSVDDRKTGTPAFVVIGLKISEQSISIEAGNISGTRVTCVARAKIDAAEL